MKKILVVMLCLLLCGCSTTADDLDMEKASKELDETYSKMIVIDDAQLEVIYGLDLSLVDEYVIKASSDNNGNLYAILKVNKDKKNEVKEQMTSMFETLITQNSLYTPAVIKLLENRLETSVGDYLIYLVGENTASLYDVVKGCIK